MRPYQCKKGIILERRVKNELIAQGYHAIRSPGSKGLFDVYAFNKNEMRCIQVKYTDISKEELARIRAFDNLPNNATKEVWILRKGEFEKMKITTSAFGELVDLFIAYYRKDCVDETLRHYKKTINDYRDFLDRHSLDALMVNTGNVRMYLSELWERELSPATISSVVTTLRKFYTFLLRHNIIKENVFDRISNPKVPEKLPEVLTEGQMNKFLDSIKDPLASALTETLYATGMRAREILTMYCEDIDTKNKLVKIIDMRSKERKVPITEGAINKIKSYRQYIEKPFRGPAFLGSDGKPLMRHDLDKIMENCSNACGLSKNVSATLIRSTLASVMLNRGADIVCVKELLGLENVESVLAYAKLSIDEKKKIIDKFSSVEEIGQTPLHKNTEGYVDGTPEKCRTQYRFGR